MFQSRVPGGVRPRQTHHRLEVGDEHARVFDGRERDAERPRPGAEFDDVHVIRRRELVFAGVASVRGRRRTMRVSDHRRHRLRAFSHGGGPHDPRLVEAIGVDRERETRAEHVRRDGS